MNELGVSANEARCRLVDKLPLFASNYHYLLILVKFEDLGEFHHSGSP